MGWMIAFLLGCARAPDLGHEYTEPIDILDADGLVQARGWARIPLFGFDRDAVPAALAPHVREWDYYGVYTPDFAVGVTLAELRIGDSGDLVLASVTVQDYLTGTAVGPSFFQVDGDDELQFAADPDGSYAMTFGNGTLTYGMDGATRTIAFTAGDDHGEIAIAARPAESMALVTPFPDDGVFFYEDKALPMAATGTLVIGGVTYALPEGASFGEMDFARGAMPATMTWDWATALGNVDGHAVGVNLGSVYGDETGGTPNAVIVDGVLHKLGRVEWANDLDDPLAPWTFTGDGVDLELTSEQQYVELTDRTIGDYHVQLWKLYGTFSGTVELDDGDVLAIDGLIGGAEHLETAW
jgi:hypothetical protein